MSFSREPDEEGDLPDVVDIPTHVWEDLGKPETITVIVEPGDKLNGDE